MKDGAHKKPSVKTSATIETKETNLCTTNRNTFSNYEKKKAFIKCFSPKIRILGFQGFECPSDADTTIVKVVLEYSQCNVLLCTQMILISYPCFYITLTTHPI